MLGPDVWWLAYTWMVGKEIDVMAQAQSKFRSQPTGWPGTVGWIVFSLISILLMGSTREAFVVDLTCLLLSNPSHLEV